MTADSENTEIWQKRLMRLAKVWVLIAALGQLAFIYHILSFYGSRVVTNNAAGWNDKNIITGHVPGDTMGNIMFGAHVLIASIVTFGGLLQLIPRVRTNFPAVHRWNGRLYITLACFLAIGGLWMTWGRGSYLSIPSGLIVSFNGILILICSFFAVQAARKRQFRLHERWALRTFMVVSGVWFFRVGLMGWILINQGPRGMASDLTGPADIALALGSYLIPLLGLEIYFRAKQTSSRSVKIAACLTIALLTALMAVGIIGASMFMWF